MELKIIEIKPDSWTFAVEDEDGKQIVYHKTFKKASLGKKWKKELINGAIRTAGMFIVRDFKDFEDRSISLSAIFEATHIAEFVLSNLPPEDFDRYVDKMLEERGGENNGEE